MNALHYQGDIQTRQLRLPFLFAFFGVLPQYTADHYGEDAWGINEFY
jgi:hypothetical protein